MFDNMTIRFRTIFIALIVFTILIASAPFTLGLGSTAFTYEGKCYGFTDGVWECPWYEYAAMQIFWSGLFTLPFAVYLFSCWLVTIGFWFIKRRTSMPDRLSLWQGILVFVFGCLGGALLISALPILINIYYKFQHIYWKIVP
jgi:hypothetical protein